MRVLSLFDGMGCGMIALRELGIEPEVYYASEIDKYAIMQTSRNFPDVIHVGDVRELDIFNLGRIDLLIGGSPCTDFSFGGRMAGASTADKQEILSLERYLELRDAGCEFEGESFLFWEYVRILTELRNVNPDILFLLENVEMQNKWENVIMVLWVSRAFILILHWYLLKTGNVFIGVIYVLVDVDFLGIYTPIYLFLLITGCI